MKLGGTFQIQTIIVPNENVLEQDDFLSCLLILSWTVYHIIWMEKKVEKSQSKMWGWWVFFMWDGRTQGILELAKEKNLSQVLGNPGSAGQDGTELRVSFTIIFSGHTCYQAFACHTSYLRNPKRFPLPLCADPTLVYITTNTNFGILARTGINSLCGEL